MRKGVIEILYHSTLLHSRRKLITHACRKKGFNFCKTCTRHRRNWSLCNSTSIRQKYWNSVHHFFMFQKGIQVKTFVNVDFKHSYMFRQIIGLLVGILFDFFAWSAPVRSKFKYKNTWVVFQ